MKRVFLGVCVVALFFASRGQTAVKPNVLFTDGAVLQQDMDVPVWGTANDGEKVTVKFQDQKVATTAKAGHWLVKLKPLKAGGPFTMTITGENTVELKDLLVGEVWICAGQSNMEMGLANSTNGPQHCAAANDPSIRLFTVPRFIPIMLKHEPFDQWQACGSNTVANFSAVGYFFGRDLRQSLNVPVGLINATVGGSTAEMWLSWSAIASNSALHSIMDEREAINRNYLKWLAQYQELEPKIMEIWQSNLVKAAREGKPPPRKPTPPADPMIYGISSLYREMIAPLQPFAIRGVIWYQGESNAERAQEYQTLFPALIENWRTAWRQQLTTPGAAAPASEFPFLFVQIPPCYGPEIREAQVVSWERTSRTAMVVITDYGDPKKVHPLQKEPVGQRLALAARAIAYGQAVEYSGPVYNGLKIEGDHAVLDFQHIGAGLVAKGGELKGFTIAGTNNVFTNATAKIAGSHVIVSSPIVPQPVAVRYDWSKNPEVTLYNQEGLPATPFRTDRPLSLGGALQSTRD